MKTNEIKFKFLSSLIILAVLLQMPVSLFAQNAKSKDGINHAKEKLFKWHYSTFNKIKSKEEKVLGLTSTYKRNKKQSAVIAYSKLKAPQPPLE